MTNRTHKCPVCNGDGRVPRLKRSPVDSGSFPHAYAFKVGGVTYQVAFSEDGKRFKVDGPHPLVVEAIIATITGGQS